MGPRVYFSVSRDFAGGGMLLFFGLRGRWGMIDGWEGSVILYLYLQGV